MACYPGTPCNPCTPVKFTFPKKCDNGWLNSMILNTANITYTGANLPNTGVDTGDNLNTVLQKIDEEFDPVTLVQTLLYTIQNNPSLHVAFCSLVNECMPTTTTTTSTSTSTSTTTTTTTAIPFMIAGALGGDVGNTPFATSGSACATAFGGDVYNSNFYTPNGVLIANGVQLSQGDVYAPFASGWYIYTYYDGNPIFPYQVFYLDSNSTVTTLITCP